jgi:hypothetical protein
MKGDDIRSILDDFVEDEVFAIFPFENIHGDTAKVT